MLPVLFVVFLPLLKRLLIPLKSAPSGLDRLSVSPDDAPPSRDTAATPPVFSVRSDGSSRSTSPVAPMVPDMWTRLTTSTSRSATACSSLRRPGSSTSLASGTLYAKPSDESVPLYSGRDSSTAMLRAAPSASKPARFTDSSLPSDRRSCSHSKNCSGATVKQLPRPTSAARDEDAPSSDTPPQLAPHSLWHMGV